MKPFCDIASQRAPRKLRQVGEHEAGLTLIEMLIVLVIIAVVAGLVTMNVINRPDEARVTTTKANVSSIGVALKTYRLDNGDYPTTQQGLQALVEKPSTPPVPTNWAQGGYLSEPPLDAWGKPYEYRSEGGAYTLRSFGKDGKPGGEGVDADIEGKG
ncbi:type II secretion system major pseudopilin GspG [Sphingomonas elodea]|uniref:type II secretion system major pseudopilin GspG n=1 Tax=Sphingomonas elodea TaxID=179878 RepID=UPI00026312D9|nr:type II secretion system major pseudopilin GspG [Sphingomonas elodea]